MPEFIARNGLIAQNNSTITGSLTVTSGITGSFQGVATTASYVLNAISASFATSAATATTASYILNAASASYALTSSFATSAVTSSFANAFTVAGTLTATTLVVQTITSSVLYSSGSNIFGNSLSNTQVMTGSVSITGSLSLNNIAIPTSASLASTYLPLTGGTLTGALNGTELNASMPSGNGALYIKNSSLTGKNWTFIPSTNGAETDLLLFYTGTGAGTRLTLASTGAATFSSSVTSTGYSVANTGGSIQTVDAGGYISLFGATGSPANTVIIGTASTERMRITSGGNVGIGTTSPGNFSGVGFTGPFLDIAGILQIKGTSANGVAIMQFGGDTYRKATIETSIGTQDPFLAFGTASSGSSSTNTERMRITSGGSVLLGTTTDASNVRLQVAASGGVGSWISGTFSGIGGTDKVVIGAYGGVASIGGHNGALNAWANLALNFDGGYVLVGSTASIGAYKLQVTGAIYATGDITAFSDISVKKNIRTIDNALERVTKSRGVIYDRKDIDSKNNIGFIAQELELQFPELISTNNDGTKGVKYQNAVAILFEAIKEQQTQINELKELIKNKL